MKEPGRMLLRGAMAVLPIGAIVRTAAGRFPHPVVAVSLLLLLLCMAAGALVRSVPGRWARTRLESAVFQRIPGCRFVADVIPGAAEAGHRPQPAPARSEEGLPRPDHRSLQGWPPRRLRARHAVAD